MVFVAEALGAWLVEQLADASQKKLTELILGSEQERALRRAADAAVWATAEEMRPFDAGRAEQIAMVISEVFRDPVPKTSLTGPVMLLESLQAGITGQLAVLDDAALTGTDRSSAEVLGVPGAVLADRLANHLMRNIVLSGSGGGPLTPLANQFNHELTRLQIGGRLAQLAEEIRNALAQQDSAEESRNAVAKQGSGVKAGWLLKEVTDPFALEVHRPVLPDGAPLGLPELPPYLPREHDQVLGQLAKAAAEGRSQIAVLVSGSSTGKTRACWEALAVLRDQPVPWRLWHPIDPSRPEAALAELSSVGPRTVVWLNEAQFYLAPSEDGLGERVAAGLRALLRDPERGPVLVLATLWPQYWGTLTARAPVGADPHAQARELLSGHDITVPAALTPAQADQLATAGDARLVLAAESATDRQVIQYLAGSRELLARYRNAPPAARALIEVAMDARRLGMGAGLPQLFLEAAAAGYLTGTEWDALAEDWAEQALVYSAIPCKGVRGPLARPRLARGATAAKPRGTAGADDGPLYQLADYLDQHGRAHRAEKIPPAEFWAAAVAYATPEDQAALGAAAHARGLYRNGVQLYKNAASYGYPRAAIGLSDRPDCLRTDPRPVLWAAAHVFLDDLGIVHYLMNRLREAGAHEQATVLASRAAAHGSLDKPGEVASLLLSLGAMGAHEQATILASRAAAQVSLDNPEALAHLLDGLREAGAHEQATVLASRAAAQVSLDGQVGVDILLQNLRDAGAHEQATVLASRAAAQVSLDDLGAVIFLLYNLGAVGAHEQAAILASRAAVHVSNDPDAVARLLPSLGAIGAYEQADALASRAATNISLDNPAAVASLLKSLPPVGAHEQADLLASRAAAHASLDNPAAVASLLIYLHEEGVHELLSVLLARDPAAHVSLDNPLGVSHILHFLLEAAANEQVSVLLARDPAAHVSLDDLDDLARLLRCLREAGAYEQATVLASRAAAHVSLDDSFGVARLLRNLRELGAYEQVGLLASRAAAHVSLDDSFGVARLLRNLRELGAYEQVGLLASRAAAHVSLRKPYAVGSLLDDLGEARAYEQVGALASRATAHVSLDDSFGVAGLLDGLRHADAHESLSVLLARNPAATVSLDDLFAVTRLLNSLREAGAREQVSALASRAAAHISLDNQVRVADLLHLLREVGADQQVNVLVGRLPAAGMFALYLEQQNHKDQYRFGREKDGSLAVPWGWDDLSL